MAGRQFSKLADSIGRILRKPLFGTRVIPRDASVNPKLFPDDEFPLCCERCGYLLRGLPDGKCPECGTEFIRAQRIVSQYVFGIGTLPWKRSAAWKWCKWLWIAGVVIAFVPMLGLVGLLLVLGFWLDPSTPQSIDLFLSGVDRIGYIKNTCFIAGPTLFVAAGIIGLSVLRRASAKRREVVRAIHTSD